MQVPPDNYSLDSFVTYLKQNREEVFEEYEAKKWLKVHTILHNLDDWPSQLFVEEEVKDFGDISEVVLEREDFSPSTPMKERFYVHEYRSGLLLFFSSAIREGYQKTVRRRIERTRGVTEAWIPPILFQQVWGRIIEEHGGYVYRFMSRRGSLDDTPAQIRPQYKRRFNYTGADGTQVLKELQELYGVLPQSLYVQVRPDLKIQLKSQGFFSAQEITSEAFDILFGILEQVQEELLQTKEISQRLKYEVRPVLGRTDGPRVASVIAGQIQLYGDELTPAAVEGFISDMAGFSFLDKSLVEGSLGFSATVVDELKGSVFNVSMSEDEIYLIPKHETTFESFLSFYRGVAEQLNDRASLRVWGTER